MDKDVFVIAEDVGKAKSLGFVEPFHPGRLKRHIAVINGFTAALIRSWHQRFGFRWSDVVYLDGLNSARSFLNADLNSGTVRDGTLTEISQHVGMKQNIRPTRV